MDERPLSCVSGCQCPVKSKILVFQCHNPLGGAPGHCLHRPHKAIVRTDGQPSPLASTAHALDPTPAQTTRFTHPPSYNNVVRRTAALRKPPGAKNLCTLA